MPTITLHVIVKDQVEDVRRIIKDYRPYFDELHFAIDSEEAFNELSKDKTEFVKMFHYTDRMKSGRIDFAAKRNFLTSKCYTDFYFRLDTDDIISNPEKIRNIVYKAEEENISVMTVYYEYSKDEWGNIDNAHYRETIIKNTDRLVWKSTSGIHECVIPLNQANFVMTDTDDIRIIHDIKEGHGVNSVKRNLEYLIDEYKEKGDETDSRTFAYLGRTYTDMKDYQNAEKFLKLHIKTSGWSEDRFMSWICLARIYEATGNFKVSTSCCFEALNECPDRPEAYYKLHDIYFQKGEWQKAIEWAKIALSKPIPKGNIPIAPSDYTWKPLLTLSECYAQLDDYDTAYKLLSKAEKYVPSLKYIEKTKKLYGEAIDRQTYVEKLTWLFEYLLENDKDLAVNLAESVPDSFKEHTLVSKYLHNVMPPKVHEKNEVTIFCGETPEAWSPKSIESGVGGSEEAVIQMSKELTKLGYKVTVYNDCGDNQGYYEGVSYQNWVRFNPRDKFNILISWRQNIFNYKVQARKKIIWVHDLPLNLNLDKDTIQFVDKIVVLSEYHKSLLPDIAKSKAYVSTNGIVSEDFIGLEKIERQPKRVIYASSYNRGLEELLEMWADVRKEVPAAELHIFYGWDMYDEYIRKGLAKDDGFKERMLKLMEQGGVYEHGRIGHKQLLEEYKKSDVFAYPCKYSGEINCVPAGTIIRTKNGGKKIEDITTDDYVVTHLGNYKRVSMTMRKRTESLFNIKVRNAGNLKITGEHPVLSSKTQNENNLKWVEARNIQAGDYVVVPKTITNQIDFIDIDECEPISKNNLPTIENEIPSRIELDETMCRWFGYFIGDGSSSSRNQVEILVSNKHIDRDYDNIKNGFLRFGLNPREQKRQGCVGLVVNSGKLTRWLKKHFYNKDRTKRIPEWLMFSKYPKSLIEGLTNSDWYSHYDSWNCEYEFTNKSIDVIEGLRQLLTNEGFACSLKKRNHFKGCYSYHIRWRKQYRQDFKNVVTEKYIFLKVLEAEQSQIDCDVYNIEVEDDNSYVAEGVAVHNCIALTKAIACGCKIVTNDFAVMAERSPNSVNDEQFKDAFIKLLKSDEKIDWNDSIFTEYIESNSWNSIAKDWKCNLFKLDIETECIDRIEWTNQQFAPYKNNCVKIIDIGANKGHIFTGWDRKRITSVDIDEYDYEGFVRADATELPFKDKEYDIALLGEIVEHVENPVKVLSEALRVSKKVVITVPYEYEWGADNLPFVKQEDRLSIECAKDMTELARRGNPTAKDIYSEDGYKHLYHNTYYTPELLKEHLDKAGYKDYKITKLRWENWAWLAVQA